MKTFLPAALLALSLPLAALAVENGKPAPAFSLPGADGKTYSLSQFKGKTVVLEWLNHGCPFVKKHYNTKNMQDLQAKYTGKGVVWLSIVSSAPGKQGHETPADHQKMATEKVSHASAILIDEKGEVGKLYSAKTTPHMYVINAQGSLVYQGAIDDQASADEDDVPKAKNYVAAALDSVLANKPVALATSTSYGCAEKY